MNLKRVFAGIAAAATMLGGLAIGATSANAADGETITITNVQDGMTFQAYQLATFSNIQGTQGGAISSLDVDTAASAVQALTSAMKDISPVVAPYTQNPAAQVAAEYNESQLRQLAEALAKVNTSLGTASASGTIANESTTIDVPAAGWYLVTSAVDGVAPAIVTSTVSGYTSIARDNESPLNTMELGKLVAKHNISPEPTKTVETDNKVVGVGDTLTYTIESTLPSAQASDTDIFFRVHDRPSTGLTIDPSKINVYVGSVDAANKLAADQYTLSIHSHADNGAVSTTEDFKTPFEGNGQQSFSVNLSDYVNSKVGEQNAGKKVIVQYTATVNDEATTDPVTNGADVATAPDEELNFETTTTSTPVGQFNFVKQGVNDAEGKPELLRAGFEVKNGDTVLNFVEHKTTDGTYYTYAPKAIEGTTVTTVYSVAGTGVLDVRGLPEGTYTVSETEAPTDYADNLKPTFNIEVTAADATDDTPATATWTLASGSNTLGLASGSQNNITVKNVKSITQLPLTGAAGITMLVVMALLLGGAAALIAVRSNSLKRQLRG